MFNALGSTVLGVGQDDRQAVQWYRKASEQGDADAQQALDRMKRTDRG
jgi:TPR repeat protein